MRRARLSGVLVFTGIALLAEPSALSGSGWQYAQQATGCGGSTGHFAHLTTTLADAEHRRA